MIANRQRRVRVSPARLGRFLGRVRRALRLGPEAVALCLVENRDMARLNRAYRGKGYATDVLSFPAQNGKAGPRRIRNGEFLGDIAIAPAVARRNAQEDGHSTEHELKILIVHGVLHLMGYDHETDDGEMQRREMKLRRQLGLER